MNYWTLQVKIGDKKGDPVKNGHVIISNKNGLVVLESKTDQYGRIKAELPEYPADGKEKIYSSPYTVRTRKMEKKIELNRNTEISFDILK